ncbi:MAG: histidine kinase dimerization/phosphoacceptor domain -containing protein, partial [Bacteroidota bacterium]
KNYPLARKYLERGLERGLEVAPDSSRLQGYLYSNLGELHQAQNRNDSAKAYLYKALNIWKYQKDPEGVLQVINKLIDLELMTRANQETLDVLLRTADDWGPKSKDELILSLHDLARADYYLSSNQFETTERLLNKVEPYLQKQEHFKGLFQCMYLRRELYGKTKEYDKLILYTEKLDSLQQEAFSRDQQRNTQELEAQYETKKKTEEYQLLDDVYQQTKKSYELKDRNEDLLIGILSLIVILAVALAWGYRTVRRKNTVIQKLNAEVNHRTLNHLAFIQKFYALEVRAATQSEQREAMQAGMAKLESMVALYRQLYNDLDEQKTVSLRSYLINLLEKLMELSSLPEDTIQLSGPELDMDVEEMKLIGLIATELVTNAVKYGVVPDKALELKISWRFTAEGKLSLVLADNGPGLPDAVEVMRQKSFGLNVLFLIAEKQLKGNLGYSYHEGAEWTLHWTSKARQSNVNATV